MNTLLNTIQTKLQPYKPKIINITVICGIVLLAYTFGTCSKPSDYFDQMKQWKAKAEQVLSDNKRITTLSDSLATENAKRKLVEDKQTQQINTLRQSASSLRQTNDSLFKVAVETAPPACSTLVVAAEGYKAEADTLRVALGKAEERDTLRVRDNIALRISVDSLTAINKKFENLVIKVPVYKPEKFLGFIPQPSRKVSFILGAIVGVVGLHEVTHK